MDNDSTTLGALVDAHFKTELTVDYIRDLPIVIEGEPDFGAKTLRVTATGTAGPGGYALVKGTNLFLTSIEVTLTRKPSGTSGTVAGTLIRDGVTIGIEIALSGKSVEQVSGSMRKGPTPFDLHHALGFLGIRTNLPDHFCTPTGIDLVSFDLTLDFTEESLTLSGKNSAGNAATVYGHKAADGWQVALLFNQSRGWKAADLSHELSVIDEFVSFRSAFIGIASHDAMDITGAIHTPLKDHTLRLHAGLNLALDVGLGSGRLSPLAKVLKATFRVDDMFLAASIGPTLKQLALEAELGALDFRIAGVDFSIPQATLSFSLEHYPTPTLGLSGELDFPDPSGKGRIRLLGLLEIGVDMFRFEAETDVHAKLVKDIFLDRATARLAVDPEGATIGFGGDVEIGRVGVAADIDLLVPELVPSFTYLDIENLYLDQVYAALYKGKKPPAALKSVVLEKVDMWDCLEAGNCRGPLDKPPFPFGSGFRGHARVFGFDTIADVEIADTGFDGVFSIDKPIRLTGFQLTDATKKNGPQIAIRSTGSPVLKASAAMEIFGYAASADIGAAGFTVDARMPVKGWGTWDISAAISTGRGSFAARLTCTGNFRKKPIVIHRGGYTISVNMVSVTLGTREFRFSVDYAVDGHKRPPINDTIPIGKIGHLSDLGREIGRKLN